MGYGVVSSFYFIAPLANTEESRMSVPLEVYRTITKYQASFLDLVSDLPACLARLSYYFIMLSGSV